MTDPSVDMDCRIAAMLRAVAEAISEELPDAGFVLIMGRSADEESYGSLISLSNLEDENAVSVLETILARRRAGAAVSPPVLQ